MRGSMKWTRSNPRSVPGIVRADLGALGIAAAQLGSMQFPSDMGFGKCQHDKAELFWVSHPPLAQRHSHVAQIRATWPSS